MDVRSDRTYVVTLGPDDLWSTLTRVDDYRSWWPWLRAFDGRTFVPGARWACTVQPPLPYAVRFVIELGEVEAPRFVTATVDGDIVGDARLDIEPTPETAAGRSTLRLVSRLGPRPKVLRTVARVARPVVRFGHDWVLDTGFRQFVANALPATEPPSRDG